MTPEQLADLVPTQVYPLMRGDLGHHPRFRPATMDGALHCTRAAYESLSQRGAGAIVNQSSAAIWMPTGVFSITKVVTGRVFPVDRGQVTCPCS